MSIVANVLRELHLPTSELASRSKLSEKRIAEILAGEQATLADLRALSRGLRIPLWRFSRPSEEHSDIGVLFRQTTANRPDAGASSAAEFVQAALAILPSRDTPPRWLEELRSKEESYREAVRLAEEFRILFVPSRPDEPLTDLPKILVDQAEVILGRLETSRFEGASVVAGGYAFAFVSPRFPGRMLFTLAHEVGHLIAHHGQRNAVHFDTASQIGSYRTRSRSEAFVDAFAAELLMPASGIGIALQEIRSALGVTADAVGDVEILYLARLFGVSFEAAARRCEQLNLLPSGGAYSLVDHLRKEHGGPEKRASALRLPPRETIEVPSASSNLLKAVAKQIDDGNVSIGWATDRFGCTASEIYRSRAIAR